MGSVKHTHLLHCTSTQQEVKELLATGSGNDANLVSTELQTNGIGRKGSDWIHYPNSLALSFSLLPAKKLSLTPLEVGIHIVEFVSSRFGHQLKLKWPNDLMNENSQKVGGIIIQSSKSDQHIVGVGINFGDLDNQDHFDHFPAGSIPIQGQLDKKRTAFDLYKFILENRIEQLDQIQKRWKEACIHLNQKVSIFEGDKVKIEGLFLGIGEDGEALIESDQDTKHIYSGSLSY